MLQWTHESPATLHILVNHKNVVAGRLIFIYMQTLLPRI